MQMVVGENSSLLEVCREILRQIEHYSKQNEDPSTGILSLNQRTIKAKTNARTRSPISLDISEPK